MVVLELHREQLESVAETVKGAIVERSLYLGVCSGRGRGVLVAEVQLGCELFESLADSGGHTGNVTAGKVTGAQQAP